MNKQTHENRMQLAVLLAIQTPNVGWSKPARDADVLGAIGKRCNNLAVALCNGWIEQDVFDRRKEKLQAKANDVLKPYNVQPGKHIFAKAGGDPRGFAFHIHGLPGNTWGGDESGFGVN
jgi:hypothetical protein